MSNVRVAKAVADVIKARTKRIFDKSNLNRLANDAKKSIIVRTRLGRGVRTTGETFKFPPLDKKYVKQRSKSSRLSSFTTAGTSNVHATGQLVEKSIRTLLLKNGFKLYLNKPRGLNLNGKKSKIDNIELNRILSRRRRWFDLSRAEKNAISRAIRKIANP